MTAPSAVLAGPPVPVTAVRQLLDRRRRLRTADVLYRLYVVALFTLPVAYAASGPGGLPPDVPRAVAILDAVLVWSPVVLIAVTVVVGRFAAWAGLVVPDAGEVAWLLTAPIRRRDLLGPRLARAVLTAAFAGGLAGYAPTLLLVAEIDRPAVPMFAAGIAGGAAYGLLVAAFVWWVQGSERRARAVVRGGPWVLAAAVAAGAAATTWSPARELLSWSGPWGWAVRPLVAAAGAPTGGVGVALLLAAATSLVAGTLTVRRADAVPLAEHARRASAFSGVRSALFGADLRFASSLRREAMRALLGVPRRRVSRPRTPWLAVPWADALMLLRAPRWLATGAVTALALHVAGTAEASRDVVLPGLVPLGVGILGALVAASQVVDGLRVEHETLVGGRYLPWSPMRIVALHLVTPVLALLVVIGIAAGVTMLLGAAPGEVVGRAALGAVLAVPVLLGGVTLSVTAPPLEPGALLSGGEAGLSWALARLFFGSQLAVALVLLAALGVLATAAAGEPIGGAFVVAAVWSLAASVGIAAGIRRRLRRLDA